jgi:hypothetical protein
MSTSEPYPLAQLTDFELQKLIDQGDEEAVAEMASRQNLRQNHIAAYEEINKHM